MPSMQLPWTMLGGGGFAREAYVPRYHPDMPWPQQRHLMQLLGI
jgi:hypothetical protein